MILMLLVICRFWEKFCFIFLFFWLIWWVNLLLVEIWKVKLLNNKLLLLMVMLLVILVWESVIVCLIVMINVLLISRVNSWCWLFCWCYYFCCCLFGLLLNFWWNGFNVWFFRYGIWVRGNMIIKLKFVAEMNLLYWCSILMIW